MQMSDEATGMGEAGPVDYIATSGGPHPPDIWAAITTAQIIQVAAKAQNGQGSELRRRILQILEAAHRCVQDTERALLAQYGDARVGAPLDPRSYIGVALMGILDAAEHSEFAAHFAQDHVREYLYQLLGNHFATTMNIERQWHVARQQP
jgi:hypothetical protein